MTLLDAVLDQDVPSLRELLAAGLDVEGDDPTTSPLLQALWHKSEEMVRLLLDAGADPNRAPKASVSALRCRGVVSPELRRIGGNDVWVFGSPAGPSLAWNWKWGVVRGGKVRWQPDFEAARAKLGGARIPGVCDHHASQT